MSNSVPTTRKTRRRTSQNPAQEQCGAQEDAPATGTQAHAYQTTDGDLQPTHISDDDRPRTRPQNKFRRPALDVGLDWHSSQREREDAAAAKSEKKAQSERKKAEKVERIHLRQIGINRVAALEEAREQRDREEDVNLNSTGTARTYVASFKSQKALLPPGADSDGSDEGSQYVAGGLGEDDESSARSEDDDDEEPAARQRKKVRTSVVTSVASLL